jgi:hypothetical protein
MRYMRFCSVYSTRGISFENSQAVILNLCVPQSIGILGCGAFFCQLSLYIWFSYQRMFCSFGEVKKPLIRTGRNVV